MQQAVFKSLFTTLSIFLINWPSKTSNLKKTCVCFIQLGNEFKTATVN